MEWLRTHKEPFEDVKARWEATHDVRIEMLHNSTKTIFDYINEFSVLQLSTGYILVITILKIISIILIYVFIFIRSLIYGIDFTAVIRF